MRIKIPALAAIVLAGLALAGCGKSDEHTLQGWVEAELVFVSPDEQGRVETLKVREGDRVEKGALLFSVDDDLQRADLAVRKSTVTTSARELRPRQGIAQELGRHAKNLRRCRIRTADGERQSCLVGNAPGPQAGG